MPKRKSKYGKPEPNEWMGALRQGGQPSLIKMAHKKGALYLPK